MKIPCGRLNPKDGGTFRARCCPQATYTGASGAVWEGQAHALYMLGDQNPRRSGRFFDQHLGR